MNNEFDKVGLYKHNENSYLKVRDAFDNGESVVGIVHATGTGKTYNALQLSYDNRDKKILYLVPTNAIIEHIEKIIMDNPKIDRERDFPNLVFRTYRSLVNMSNEELEQLDVDLLILDELHHLGAPIWGARVNKIIDSHEDIKIFGMSAYTVRDRGTEYERDMANPDTEELFSNKIVSRYDLCDAMIDGIIPKPIYKSTPVFLIDELSELEEKVSLFKASSIEYQAYDRIIKDCKKRILESPKAKELILNNIKKDGKYIYFCPLDRSGQFNIDEIIDEFNGYLKDFIDDEDVIIYKTTSKMGELGKDNRDAFYDDKDLDGKDVSNKLRIMFAINQYNEGVHAPNIDGVIMGRGTSSDIVYFEQLGRALSVRGNTKEKYDELNNYSYDELIMMCRDRDIKISDGIDKKELIEKLIAPVIIDLANNFEFIRTLENNLKDRVREVREKNKNLPISEQREIKISDASFDIDVLDMDLFNMLSGLRDRINISSWDRMYEYAKGYYNKHGNLKVPRYYKIKIEDGLDVNLGFWISNQRRNYKQGMLSQDKQRLLEEIGMRFDIHLSWEEMYEYAKDYYNECRNLEVPIKYKIKIEDGLDINLGAWVYYQRTNYKQKKLSQDKQRLLEEIGMRFDNKLSTLSWEEMYEYAKEYYNEHGDLEVPKKYKTKIEDGLDINLGAWISTQRTAYKQGKLSQERQKLLEELGMRFDNKLSTLSWQEMYKYAKEYYNEYDNLKVPRDYKIKIEDGLDVNLGFWISNQRRNYKQGKLSQEKQRLLEELGMRFDNKNNYLLWEEMYEYAKEYYNEYGNLEVPHNYKIKIEGQLDINLGAWIGTQRNAYKQGKLSQERQKLLEEIVMRFDNKYNYLSWEEMYEYAKEYYNEYGDLDVPRDYKIKIEDGLDINLGLWINIQRNVTYKQGKLSQERKRLLEKIGMRFDSKRNNLSWEEMYKYAKDYYNEHGNLKLSTNYKIKVEDQRDINLGMWVNNQRRNFKQGKLSQERQRLLEKTGMIWDVSKNRYDIKKICNKYGINYNKNYGILKNISIKVFISKINYLNSNNIELVNNEGILYEIFSMSNINMIANYGISLEELIDKYYIDYNKGRGV